MIALVIGSTIAFCIWAHTRFTGNGIAQQQTSRQAAEAAKALN
jgi:hypothetical protein